MAKREIFLQREIRCPACKEISKYKYPNPRLYAAGKRDTDMRVIVYRWAEGVEPNTINPHHFDVWQCPNCSYADFMNSCVNSELINQSLKSINAFRSLDTPRKQILVEMKSAFGSIDDQFKTALNSHLAALFVNYLPAKEDRHHNKIGRLALRISWLFKELGGEAPSNEILPETSKVLSELEKETSNLEGQLFSVRDSLAGITTLAESRIREMGLDPETAEADDEPYRPLLNSLNGKLEELITLKTMMQRIIIGDERSELDDLDEEVEMAETNEITDLLLLLKKHWSELPLNEDQAVHQAIDAFDYSYKNENYYQSIEQSMSVVALIVDLYGRIGEFNEALIYVGEIYRSGMRMKQELQSRIKTGRSQQTLTAHDERMINRKMGNITTAIRQAGDKRRELIKIVLKKLTPKINKLLQVIADASPQEQVIAMKKNGIPDEIIHELKSRNILKKEKKKGLFG